MSSPVATVVNGQSQCYIAWLTFQAPTTAAHALAGAVADLATFNVTHAPLKLV